MMVRAALWATGTVLSHPNSCFAVRGEAEFLELSLIIWFVFVIIIYSIIIIKSGKSFLMLFLLIIRVVYLRFFYARRIINLGLTLTITAIPIRVAL